MATAGGPQQTEPLTCSLCLEEFKNPKFLPCHHTFCLKCLETLTSHLGSKSFPCPQCRLEVTIPPGGVAAFQENFYIQSEGPRAVQSGTGTTCPVHAEQPLDLYCADCQVPVCLKCAMTKHKQHVTKDLHEAAREVSDQLKDDEYRLQMAVAYMTNLVETEKTQQQTVKEKTAATEEAIRKNYATLVDLSVKALDEALASLNTISGEIDRQMAEELESKQGNLDKLHAVRRRFQNVVCNGESIQLLAIAKDMREGQGSLQSVQQLLSPKKSYVSHPVLNSTVPEDAIRSYLQGFVGTVEEVKMRITTPEVKVAEQFRCGGEQGDVEVFSVCPIDDGKKVVVSFARRDQKEDAPSEEFDEDGVQIVTLNDACGKQNWKSLEDGRRVHISYEESGLVRSCTKSQKKTIFLLSSNVSPKRTADINTVNVVSDDPVRIEIEKVFTIQVGIHRAFDVDTSEKLFVVVEEAKPSETQRKVRLYRHGRRNAVATYRTPSTTYQPSDVCFYKEKGGREVLVVADEGADRLHVLDVRNGEFKFERYLVVDDSRLAQPKALNTDSTGRLWVACKGGAILTLTHTEVLSANFPVPDSDSDRSSAVKGNSLKGLSKWFK